MVKLALYDSVGLGLIVEMKTGVVYTQQTGGTFCLQPSIEGAYLPLCNDCSMPDRTFMSPELELCDYFSGPKYKGSGAIRGLDESDADFIDSVLAKARLQVEVNRNRLSESHESWVHVRLGIDGRCPRWQGLPPSPAGVLTWSNSD